MWLRGIDQINRLPVIVIIFLELIQAEFLGTIGPGITGEAALGIGLVGISMLEMDPALHVTTSGLLISARESDDLSFGFSQPTEMVVF